MKRVLKPRARRVVEAVALIGLVASFTARVGLRPQAGLDYAGVYATENRFVGEHLELSHGRFEWNSYSCTSQGSITSGTFTTFAGQLFLFSDWGLFPYRLSITDQGFRRWSIWGVQDYTRYGRLGL